MQHIHILHSTSGNEEQRELDETAVKPLYNGIFRDLNIYVFRTGLLETPQAKYGIMCVSMAQIH
jgi:hypothetical protein